MEKVLLLAVRTVRKSHEVSNGGRLAPRDGGGLRQPAENTKAGYEIRVRKRPDPRQTRERYPCNCNDYRKSTSYATIAHRGYLHGRRVPLGDGKMKAPSVLTADTCTEPDAAI